MPTVTLSEIHCQCCDGAADMVAVNITFSKNDPAEILCATCERLIEEGFLRPETVGGRMRYRQWHLQPMTPGELLPAPKPR